MAKQTVASNEKALKFQEFLIDNDINVFGTETLDDDYATVIFRSRIETSGQILPMAIFIDTSIFTIIRTQIVTDIAADKEANLVAYLNQLNAKYKSFKYYVQNRTLYLDVCLPSTTVEFDSKMIQVMLTVLIQHLDVTYKEIMAQVWG